MLIILFFLNACSDFVEVDLPKNKLTSETVFEDPAIAEAALRGVYGKMRDNGLFDPYRGLSTLMGIYTDDIESSLTFSDDIIAFQNHTLLVTNTYILGWWNAAYNQIYEANAIIEGVSNALGLSSETVDQFKGEALFIRAYLHLFLTELFGSVPYITTKNYQENTHAVRIPRDLVYEHIISDLTLAADLLAEDEDTVSSNRIRPYVAAANAVLARAYLYIEDWDEAEKASTMVIERFGALESDLDAAFLIGSSEIIWQFKSELDNNNTEEAKLWIPENLPPDFYLSELLFDAFEANDLRQSKWMNTATNTIGAWHYPFKYKEAVSTGASVEYSVQLRLAEQYLIRAEARARQGNNKGAQEDINIIRNRAGLDNTTVSTKEDLLEAILQERRVELFTEQAHRWFDLKRMGKASEVLTTVKPNWQDTNILLPIPDTELMLNPNLLPQNAGY